ncbi:MAG: hypothetical protein N2202_04300 [Proteobacteria bacterium]|nr:hypothetical protein [Pseudomonadota bacterium]
MSPSTKNTFTIEYHKNLISDLSKISDYYRNAIWYFLVTISTLGVAYLNIYKINFECFKYYKFIFFIICLTGNIIFWLICEYALSHAFLYRFVQTKLASIEKRYIGYLYSKIKDPSDEGNFIKNKNQQGIIKLNFEYFIPDQFVPIYWISHWLIIINTVTSYYFSMKLEGSSFLGFNKMALFYLLISVPLIWKILKYYLYKLEKFINENCKFKIVFNGNQNNSYFNLSTSENLIGVIISSLFYTFCCLISQADFNFSKLIFCCFIGFFWHVFIWMILHFLKFIFNLYDILNLFFNGILKIKYNNNFFSIEQNRFLKIITILYYLA